VRTREFELGSIALVADQLAVIPEGWVARSAALRDVWSLNRVGLHGPIQLDDALELADRHLGDLPYRDLTVEHELSGRRLEQELQREGWRVERDVTMVMRRDPDRVADTGLVVEVGEDDVIGLMRRWTGEDEAVADCPESDRQVLEASRLTWRARRARHLAVLDGDGSAVAMTMLFSDGVVAQVEDVYTVAQARGRGYGRALLTQAIRLARQGGHELTFIVADDKDWPKQLYAQMGFEPVGRRWLFHRSAAGQAPAR